MSTDWKANKETEKAIRLAADDWRLRVVPLADQLTSEIGAKNFLFSYGFFSVHVSGFEFEAEPDTKLFVRMKNMANCWRPRALSLIGKRMDKLQSDYIQKIKEILGVKTRLETMGVEFLKSCVVISWIFDSDPIGCTRITDVQYEKLLKKESGIAA